MMRPLWREQQTFTLDTHRYLGRIKNLKSEGAPVLGRGSQGFKAGPEHSPSEGPGGEAFGSSLTLVDFSIFKTCSNSTKPSALQKYEKYFHLFFFPNGCMEII